MNQSSWIEHKVVGEEINKIVVAATPPAIVYIVLYVALAWNIDNPLDRWVHVYYTTDFP